MANGAGKIIRKANLASEPEHLARFFREQASTVTAGQPLPERNDLTTDGLGIVALQAKTLPSAPDASVVSVKTKTPIKKVTKRSGKRKKKYYLIVAPKTCKGTWKGTGTFYFTTGQTLTVPFSQKCKK